MAIESHRAQAALRESEEYYRAVAEAATDAIITIDSDSTILIINPATERIFGYFTEEMIGQPLTIGCRQCCTRNNKPVETVLVSHIGMPTEDGYELIRRVGSA